METEEQIRISDILTIIAVIIAIELFISRIIPKGVFSTIAVVGCVRILQTLSVFVILRVNGKKISSMGIALHKLKKGFYRGLLWSFGFGILVLFSGLVLHLKGINPTTLFKAKLPEGTYDIILLYVVGCFIAPVAEEVIFRGILYRYFRRWGIVFALLGSTLLFVAAHALKSGIPVPQIVGGVLFAISFEIEDNLVVPITIHVLGNAAIFSLSLLT